MNEETLNHTTTIRGDRHLGGFIVLDRAGDRCWRAVGWSAFVVQLILPLGSCNCFRDDDDHAVVELSASNVMQLDSRLEVVGNHTSDRMVFTVPPSLTIAQPIFDRWQNSLPAAPNTPSHGL